MTPAEEFQKKIGLRVLAWSITRDIPAFKLAVALDVSVNRITRISNGTTVMTAFELVSIAKALGVPPSVIIGEDKATEAAK